MKLEQKLGLQAYGQPSPQDAGVIQFLSTTQNEQFSTNKETLKSVAHKKSGH